MKLFKLAKLQQADKIDNLHATSLWRFCVRTQLVDSLFADLLQAVEIFTCVE